MRGPCLKRRAAVARGSLGVNIAPSERALGPAAAGRAAICRLRKLLNTEPYRREARAARLVGRSPLSGY